MNEDVASSRVLGIFGMSIFTRRGDLEKLFEEFGPIEKVEVIHNRQVSSCCVLIIYFNLSSIHPSIDNPWRTCRPEDQKDSVSSTLNAKRTPKSPVSRPTASS